MICHSQPTFTIDDEISLRNVLRSGFVTNGPTARKFGSEVARLTRRKWGIATQSGTDALVTSLHILGVREGDRVAMPAYMCSSPLDAVAIFRAIPVPVDIDRNTLSIDPSRTNELENIKCVIVPHLFGIPAAVNSIRTEIIIEDCAQTLTMNIDSMPVGAHGLLSICSFYGTKLLATGHGGMVLGNDGDLEKKAIDLLTHDNRENWEPHYHFFMSDLNAALGLSQLQRLQSFIDRRREIAGRYLSALTGNDALPNSIFSRFLVVARNVEHSLEYFRSQGIEAKRPVYKPISMMLNLNARQYPNTSWAHDHIVSIPIYPGLNESEIEAIIAVLSKKKGELTPFPYQ